MICPICQAENSDGSAFCGLCLHRFDAVPTTVVAAAPSVPEPGAAPQPDTRETPEDDTSSFDHPVWDGHAERTILSTRNSSAWLGGFETARDRIVLISRITVVVMLLGFFVWRCTPSSTSSKVVLPVPHESKFVTERKPAEPPAGMDRRTYEANRPRVYFVPLSTQAVAEYYRSGEGAKALKDAGWELDGPDLMSGGHWTAWWSWTRGAKAFTGYEIRGLSIDVSDQWRPGDPAADPRFPTTPGVNCVVTLELLSRSAKSVKFVEK